MMPVEDRAADTWEPLLVIAEIAGGHWPELAREVCKIMTSQAATDEGTLGERLLADLRTVFGAEESLWTSSIIESLVELDEAPWASYRDKRKDPRITSREIAYLLRVYSIRSKDVRIAKQVRKGYLREDFVDAWTRYLEPVDADEDAADPAPRTTHATGATSATNNDQSNVSAGQEPDRSVADRDSSNATEAPDPLHGGQVFPTTAAWDAAGRPGLTSDPQPTHRCAKCGKTHSPPPMVAAYPHSGCGGLWVPR